MNVHETPVFQINFFKLHDKLVLLKKQNAEQTDQLDEKKRQLIMKRETFKQ